MLSKISKIIKQNKLLLGIILLAIFFRIYRTGDLLGYGHEQDLQAWISKDILVNKHPRLIGQETSIMGLFIGPLYYYTMALFFAIFGMSPMSSVIPVTLVSVATLISVYYTVRKLHNEKAALIASFIYSISVFVVFLDRWIVPTQTTLIWIVWFWYAIISIARGNYKVTPILIILLALIWHIHIAFVPLLLLIPIAIYFSREEFQKGIRKINQKHLIISIVIFIILTIPLIAFELRHGFGQLQALVKSLGAGFEPRTGYYKFYVIVEHTDRILREPYINIRIFPWAIIGYFVAIFMFVKSKVIKIQEAVIYIFWIVITIGVHFVSHRLLTEYYFNNLIIPSIIVGALIITKLCEKKTWHKYWIAIGLVFFIVNLGRLDNKPRATGEYLDKLSAVKFIKQDKVKNNYPCIGINYIGELGVEYGYRYLFWWQKIDQIAPGNDIPVYSIVRPFEISESEVVANFGDIGVILPRIEGELDFSSCNKPERQLLPLNGFVN